MQCHAWLWPWSAIGNHRSDNGGNDPQPFRLPLKLCAALARLGTNRMGIWAATIASRSHLLLRTRHSPAKKPRPRSAAPFAPLFGIVTRALQGCPSWCLRVGCHLQSCDELTRVSKPSDSAEPPASSTTLLVVCSSSSRVLSPRSRLLHYRRDCLSVAVCRDLCPRRVHRMAGRHFTTQDYGLT